MSHIDDVLAGIHGAVDALANDRDVYRRRWFLAQARYECLMNLAIDVMDALTVEQRGGLGSIAHGTHPDIARIREEMGEEYP